MLNLLDRISRLITTNCNILGTLLCAGIAIVVFLGVVFRYVFNMPLAWGEEVPKYFMVWMTFIGAPVVIRHGGHVALDAWHKHLNKVLYQLVRLAITLFCCFLLSLFIYYGWNSALMAQQQKMILVGGLSMFWVYLAVPVGSILFFIVLGIEALKELASIFQNEDAVIASAPE